MLTCIFGGAFQCFHYFFPLWYLFCHQVRGGEFMFSSGDLAFWSGGGVFFVEGDFTFWSGGGGTFSGYGFFTFWSGGGAFFWEGDLFFFFGGGESSLFGEK